MAEPSDLPLVNPWAPPARPAKRPLSGFIPSGPSTFSIVPPPGNPVGLSSVAIQRVYKNTAIDAVIPPAPSAAPVPAPTVTITSFSFAGVEGTSSSRPTWTWSYGGGPAASVAWTVYGDASATPTTIVASGTTPITSYEYTGETVTNFYYKITVSATNATDTASASDTRRNAAPVAPPTVTLTSFGFAGVAGSTSAQPTWNWEYGGGAATSYAWTVYGDASDTPTTVLATGTTPITSYSYTGATVGFYYYKITVSATNAADTASASYTQRNSPVVGPPTVIITSFSFAGVQGSTSAQPTWNWTYGGGAPDTYAWTVFGDASTTPTTIIASGTTPITSYAYTGATVANYYYKMTVQGTNPAGTATASETQANTLAAPAVTLTSFSFAGVQGSTSAQPTWTWAYGGGPATTYTWTVYGDGATTPTTIVATGTTPITSYAYTGATVANYYYRIGVSAANATSVANAFDTQRNVATAAPTVAIASFFWAGAQGSTSAQPSWTWSYGGGPAASYAWTVLGDLDSTPTTILASGTSPITTYTYMGATVPNYTYKIVLSVTNAVSTASAANQQLNSASGPPEITQGTVGFLGVQGSTTARPSYNWTFGGGAIEFYFWYLEGGSFFPPDTTLDSGTTPITSYTYEGATNPDYIYRMTVNASNGEGAAMIEPTLINSGSGTISYVSQSIGTGTAANPTGTVSSSSAFPIRVSWRFYVSATTTDPGTNPPATGWTLVGGTVTQPATGTNTRTLTTATIVGRYYRFLATLQGAAAPNATYGVARSPVSMLCSAP